jgi:Ca2+-binding RTX toxin-like protein
MRSRPRVLGIAIVLLTGTVGTGVATAAPAKCFGEPATIVGTSGDDRIRGTNGHDVIVTRDGADTVRGRGGFDSICGGPVGDRLFGGPGGEFLFGGKGDDRLRGGAGPFSDYAPGPGRDRVVGSNVVDDIVHFTDAEGPIEASLITQKATGQGADELVSVEHVLGGPFADALIGNGTDNTLVGRAGADSLRGGEGFDFLAGQKGDDIIHGGADFDIADYYEENSNAGSSTSGPITVNLEAGTAEGEGSDTLGGIEGATGSDGDDDMTGDEKGNAFFLLVGGDDTVDLGGGDDFVDAGPGADDLSGASGIDYLGMFDGNGGQPRSNGVTVDLSTNTTSDADTLGGFEGVFGTPENDTLIGDGSPNGLFPFDGDDTVAAGAGNDLVDPGNGTDIADGEVGTDILGNIDHYEGAVTIDLSDNSNSDGDTLVAFEDLVGSPFADDLTGDVGPNVIFGYRGEDVLSGLSGDDLLVGDQGHDEADGGDGSDRCQAEHQQNCEFGWSRSSRAPSDRTFDWAYRWRTTLTRLGHPFRSPHS